MARKKKKWIQKAIQKPGSLRETLEKKGLATPGKPIPVTALRRAAKGEFGTKTAQRARLALYLRKARPS